MTLTLVEISESPQAVDDQATTEAGVPVVIDVLANDLLPDGQQISLIAVTLPFRGRLTFNPDKTLTYTPNPGFVGTDDFSYTIGNGQGGTAKAKVTIEVTTATVVDTYANGYGIVGASSCRRRRAAKPRSRMASSCCTSKALGSSARPMAAR